MSLAMAVFGRMPSISAVTSAIVLLSSFRVFSSGVSSVTWAWPVVSSTTLRHRRCRKRMPPTTLRVFHGRDSSSGPMLISYRRKVSAP